VQRARADLALGRAGRQQPLGVDVRGQLRLVDEHAVHAQHVRHEVVGEDRKPVEVAEFGQPGQGEVVRHDLRALVEAAVVEEAHAACQQCREPLGRAGGLGHQVLGPAAAEEAAQLSQGLGVEAHQRVLRRLAEHPRHLGGLEAPQRGVVPGAVLGERRLDRAVARQAGALAQRREPARAEVDRVELEDVVGAGRLRGVELRVRRGLERVQVDRDEARALGDRAAARAHLVQ
jgi:hypothetical protein